MPELPETETIARDLDRLARGLGVVGITVRKSDVLRGSSPEPFVSRQLGAAIERVDRRAKTVAIHLSTGDTVLVTPRFTGALQFDVAPDSYVAVEWQLSDGHTLSYRDVRRLGTVTIVDEPGYLSFHQELGEEPLGPGFTLETLSGIVRGSRIPIKKLLMDQRKVAGVGNIYANESLWHSGIDPSRAAGSLAEHEVGALVREIRAVLEASIEARGTTFRDYRDASNQRGGFAVQLRAYGRGGMPCERCSTRLTETHAIDGRSTVFCHRCQH